MSETFWLTVTNLGLGGAVAALCLRIAYLAGREILAHRDAPREATVFLRKTAPSRDLRGSLA